MAPALSLLPGPAGVLLLCGAAAVAAGPVLRLPEAWRARWAGLERRVVPPPLQRPDPLRLLRWFLVGSQAATILVTWGLWSGRSYPPQLPAAALPDLEYGWLLLASLPVVLAKPRLGAWAHAALLAAAVLADQTRLQPEVVSLALLILATCLPRFGPTLGRAHLSTLWLWAGTHKLLSLHFMSGSAVFMYQGLPFELPWLRSSFGWVVAGSEIAAGLLTAFPRTRRAGVVLAMGMHGMILIVLSPWGQDWNRSVWPWNLALGVSAAALFLAAGGRGEVPARERRRRLALAGAVLLYPAGFYLGVVDAYLSHHLYSNAVAAAYCRPSGCRSARFADTWEAFEVPLPPEPRLFRAYFEATCLPGETLVQVPRQTRLLAGLDAETVVERCPG